MYTQLDGRGCNQTMTSSLNKKTVTEDDDATYRCGIHWYLSIDSSSLQRINVLKTIPVVSQYCISSWYELTNIIDNSIVNYYIRYSS